MPERRESPPESRQQILLKKLDTEFPWVRSRGFSNRSFSRDLIRFRSSSARAVEELADFVGLLEALKKSEAAALHFEMERVVVDFLAQAIDPMKKEGSWGHTTPNRSSIYSAFDEAAEETVEKITDVLEARDNVSYQSMPTTKDRLRKLIKSEIEPAVSFVIEYLWNELKADDWQKKAVALRRRLEKVGNEGIVFNDFFAMEADPDFEALLFVSPYAKENDFRYFSGLGRGRTCQMVFRLKGDMLVLDQTSEWDDEKISGRYLLYPPKLNKKQIFDLTKKYLMADGRLQIDSSQFFPSAFERLGLEWPEIDLSANPQPSYSMTLEKQGEAIHVQLKETAPQKRVIFEKDLLV